LYATIIARELQAIIARETTAVVM